MRWQTNVVKVLLSAPSARGNVRVATDHIMHVPLSTNMSVDSLVLTRQGLCKAKYTGFSIERSSTAFRLKSRVPSTNIFACTGVYDT